MTSSSVLTVSRFLRHIILDLIVSENVKMRGPTPNTPGPGLVNQKVYKLRDWYH
jgi:hypothetical protein